VAEGRGNTGGTRDAARKLGMNEKTIRNAERAASLTPEARAVVQQHKLSQRAALEIARANPEEQVIVARQIAARHLWPCAPRTTACADKPNRQA